MGTPTHPDGIPAAITARSPRRWWVLILISVVAIVMAHLLDVAAWTHIKDPKIYERDWGRLLRSAGFLPTWFIVAIALWGQDRSPAYVGANPGNRTVVKPGWGWRGGLMALAPTAGGALAEVVKLLCRRLRPGETSPAYVFRPFLEDPWSNRGMGMPSSHVLVAMSAATVLARLFPRVWWLWYAIAVGCAYTRVAAGAHYLSDTVVALVLGWWVGDAFARWGLSKKPPEA